MTALPPLFWVRGRRLSEGCYYIIITIVTGVISLLHFLFSLSLFLFFFLFCSVFSFISFSLSFSFSFPLLSSFLALVLWVF